MSTVMKYAQAISEQVKQQRALGLHTDGNAINEAEDSSHTYGAAADETSERKAERAYNHVDKVMAHAEKKGYKINHNDGVSKKAHAKPDITFHTDGNDDAPGAYTVHKGGAAHSDSKVNPGAKHHAYMYSGSPA